MKLTFFPYLYRHEKETTKIPLLFFLACINFQTNYHWRDGRKLSKIHIFSVLISEICSVTKLNVGRRDWRKKKEIKVIQFNSSLRLYIFVSPFPFLHFNACNFTYQHICFYWIIRALPLLVRIKSQFVSNFYTSISLIFHKFTYHQVVQVFCIDSKLWYPAKKKRKWEKNLIKYCSSELNLNINYVKILRIINLGKAYN